MRLQIEIETTATKLPWEHVLGPGRGVAYHLLGRAAPNLASQLHEFGWGPYRMTPIGYSAPLFPSAPRRQGHYAVGGRGLLEFGSPLAEVVEAWAAALRDTSVIAWGGTALQVRGVRVAHPPLFTIGRARMRTTTPVVIKGSGRDGNGSGCALFRSCSNPSSRVRKTTRPWCSATVSSPIRSSTPAPTGWPT